MLPRSFEKIGVFGRSGSGKSSVLAELFQGEPRVILLDPLRNVEGRGWHRMSGQMEAVRARIANSKGRFKIAYQPERGVDGVKAMVSLTRMLLALLDHNRNLPPERKVKVMFGIEEMTKTMPLNAHREDSALDELVDRGRHYGLRLVGASQAISRSSIAFRENLDSAVILAQMSTTARKTAADLIDVPISDVKALKDHEYIAYHNGTVTRGQTKKIPAS